MIFLKVKFWHEIQFHFLKDLLYVIRKQNQVSKLPWKRVCKWTGPLTGCP